MPITGEPRDYYKKFKFVVEIDSVAYAGFQKCSALEMETAVIEHWEGGALAADKSPGRVTFSNVSLERGATDDEDLWNWAKEVSNIVANAGVVSPKHERNLDIVQQNRDGSVRARWRLSRAWPPKFTAGDWDNDADENVIEKLDLCYHHFNRIKA